MDQKTFLNFWFLVLVSLTLVGCGSTWTQEPVVDQPVPEQVAEAPAVDQNPSIQAPEPKAVDVEENQALIEERAQDAAIAEVKEDTDWTQSITAWEVLYAAKVGDTIEAHPAWMTLTVTLDDDIITWLNVDQQSSSPKSARHQAQFAQAIEWQVIGKKLTESNTVYLSVASSTSAAFNDSINEIIELYNEAQG